MKTVTISKAMSELKSMVDYSLDSHEEINIATDNGSVILLPQEDYESMKETLNLLMDKKSLKALLDGHEDRSQGKRPKSLSVEDVFSDLQN